MKIRNKNKHRDAYAFGDDPDEISDEVPPGKSVRVPLMLVDAHRPRYWVSPLTSEQATALLDARKKRPPDDDGDDDDEDENGASLSDARAAALQARQEMIDRATSAWRTLAPNRFRDGAEPDNNSSAETKRQFVRGSDDPADAQAKRDQAYQDVAVAARITWRWMAQQCFAEILAAADHGTGRASNSSCGAEPIEGLGLDAARNREAQARGASGVRRAPA
jgi:hypothetical protein